MDNTTAIVDEPRYTDAEAISATEPARVTLSGALSAEIDSDILIHAADADVHHARYTRSENDAILGTDGITITSGTNDITASGFRAEFVNTSGSLQTQIDNIEVDEIEPAIVGGVGITVTSGVDTTTVDGHLRYTSSENEAIVAGSNITVVSGSNTITVSSTAAGGGDTSDALIGADGITIISGSNTTTISGFRDEFVSASGALQTAIDAVEGSDVDSLNSLTGDIVVVGKGEVSVTVEGQNVVVSGTDHATDTDTDTVSDAIIGGTGITVTSGSNITTIDGHLRYTKDENDAIVAGANITVTSGSDTIEISASTAPPNAIIGVDGITVISGANTTTVSGFRDEFVSASGSLQTQIDAIDVDEIEPAIIGGVGITVTSGVDTTTVDGHLRYTKDENDAIIGVGEVVVTSGAGVVVISGTPHPEDQDTVSDALAGVDGITVISGASITTISGFRDEMVNMSGTLSVEIDTDIATHTAIEDAHHTRYTRAENDAILGGVGITVTSGSNEITVDGHLRYTSDENDAIVGVGEVIVTSGTGVIVVSGTPHPADQDTISDAIIGGVGITVTSGVDTTTIDGHLRYTKDENDAIIGGVGITVTSGIDSIAVDGHLRYTKDENDAILGVDGITVISGADTVTISGFRDEFVSTSGSLQDQIDAVEGSDVDSINSLTGDVTIVDAGKVFVSTAGQTITVSGLPDDLDVDAIVVSGVSFTGNVTLSGVGGIQVAPDETDPQVITVSGEPLPTTSGQIIDPNFLTINRVRIGFGKNGNTNGAYLRVEGAASNNTGHVMMRPAQLTGLAAFYDGGAAKKDFKIRKNGEPTNLAEFTVTSQVAFVDENFPVPLEFNTGDRVQVFVASSGSSIKDPNVWMEIGWRAVE